MISVLSPRILLRFEGIAVLGLALVLFSRTEASWLVFVLLFLAPDLSLLGSLAGSRTGSAAYNLVHTYTLPLVLAAYGLVSGDSPPVHLSLICLRTSGWTGS